RAAGRAVPVRGGEGFHHRRWCVPDRGGYRRRRAVGEPDPDHARTDHAGPQGTRRAGEPRGGRDSEVRGEAGDTMSAFGTIEEAVAAVAAGRPVVVVDDEDRENEGDLIFAAELATPELMAFTVRHTSGFICAPLTEADADRLEL